MIKDDIPKPQGASLSAIVNMIKPFWISEWKWKAYALLAFVGVNVGTNAYIAIWFNTWQGSFMNAVTQYHESAIMPLLLQFTSIIVVTMVVGVVHYFASTALTMYWRKWMTMHLLDRWFADNTYYRIERDRLLDNPDQRISEDIQLFVTLSYNLIMGIVSTLVTLTSFIVVLWRLSGPLHFEMLGRNFAIPGYMVCLAVVYAIGTSFLTQFIGRRLMPLTFAQQRFEADFRFKMANVREHAEQIALYRGASVENGRMRDSFESVWANLWRLLRFNMRFDPYTNVLGIVAFMVPMIAALPKYFAHAIDFGGMTRMGGAFSQVNNSLSWFVNNYTQLQQYRAVVARLTELDHATKSSEEKSGISVVRGSATDISVAKLSLRTPDGRKLFDEIDFAVAPGERVLIRGKSGVGKSTVMRAIAGIWPYGTGTIDVPANAKTLVLSQRNYVPSGTLKAALCYPSDVNAFGDEECRQALIDCQLNEYVDRLDEVHRWGALLSPGEQQRLAIARALLHKPDFLFLDESTNATDAATEQHLYKTLIKRLPRTSLVSISHNATLDDFHTRTIRVTSPDQRLVLES
jgi:putative ATP-binding cassette transporter